jgi:hypothetical protein
MGNKGGSSGLLLMEVHSFVNDLERPVGTYLNGRRMYETMVYSLSKVEVPYATDQGFTIAGR